MKVLLQLFSAELLNEAGKLVAWLFCTHICILGNFILMEGKTSVIRLYCFIFCLPVLMSTREHKIA